MSPTQHGYPRNAHDDPPPAGEWVIGLWFGEVDPPESGTMELRSDGIWYDEVGDCVGPISPTHWIPLPDRP